MNKELIKLIDKYTDEDIIIAFSGGVDSSLLLKLACDNALKKGTKVYAVTFHTRLHPMKDLEISTRVAREMGAIHKVIKVDELNEIDIKNNPIDRCYHCKRHLFSSLITMAGEMGVKTIVDGTNADDLKEYRPGLKALKELDVKSPLAITGCTKEEVREMAKELGISVANRPSAPCLATRFPYDTEISYEVMEEIEKAENYISELGFFNVRVRVHGDIARIEVDEKEIAKLVDYKDEIVKYMKKSGFLYVCVDLEGFRSGSMDKKFLT